MYIFVGLVLVREKGTHVGVAHASVPMLRAVHPVDNSVDSGTRMIMGLMYWRSSADDNIYAHPLPWVPILDATTRKVQSPAHISSASPNI